MHISTKGIIFSGYCEKQNVNSGIHSWDLIHFTTVTLQILQLKYKNLW